MHSTPTIGALTDRWIDLQAQATCRYASRVLALQSAADERRREWMIASDRIDLRLAYRGMYKSDGISPVWLATHFRGDRRPSVVHAHYAPPGAQLVRFVQTMRRPLVVSFYGYDASRTAYTESRLWRRRYARMFDAAAAFVVEGPHMGQRVLRLGCPEEKLHVVRLPAAEQDLQGIQADPAGRYRVVMAGRFIEKKGFDTGIRAFARAFRQVPDAELLMIGGGPLEDEYRRTAEAEGIGDRVTWGGRLPFGEFMSAIATAHVALYPSRTARDGDSEGGAPVTLIESQWLGVPSIVSTHDDLPFAAGPGAAAQLDPLDVDAWAEALRALADAPGARAELRDAGRTFVREHHSPAANAKGRERVYDLARGRSG